MAIPRRYIASQLVNWIGAQTVSIVETGSGWPSRLRVVTPNGDRTVAAHVGPIAVSRRGRYDERRLQYPGVNCAILSRPTEVPLLLGVTEELRAPLIVGVDTGRRLGKSTPQSIYMPWEQLSRAARDGWAEHVSSSGERIIAFTPTLLPAYVERQIEGNRAEPIYDASELLRSSNRIRTEITSKIVVANAALAERLQGRPEGVHELTPRQFEELIGELLTDMRCGRIEITPFTRDGGRDLLAYIDLEFGQLLCLVEAKKYRADRPVGIEIVRSLYGVLHDEEASHATVVTTSSFTAEAVKFESRHPYRLSLRDYQHVVEWIRRYGRRNH